MPEKTIADDELLYRRIPPGSSWFEPPDRISSFNFKLRPGESGISVYRVAIVDASDVLKKPEAKSGSGVAQAAAGPIRTACDASNKPFDLDVVPTADEHDPGHAEIRGPSLHHRPKLTAKALCKLFYLVVHPDESGCAAS